MSNHFFDRREPRKKNYMSNVILVPNIDAFLDSLQRDAMGIPCDGMTDIITGCSYVTHDDLGSIAAATFIVPSGICGLLEVLTIDDRHVFSVTHLPGDDDDMYGRIDVRHGVVVNVGYECP